MAIHKYLVAVFVLVVAFHEVVITQGREMKALNQRFWAEKDSVVHISSKAAGTGPNQNVVDAKFDEKLDMAYTTRTCFFFVLLVLSHELLFVEARNLKQTKDNLPNSAKDTTKPTVITSRPTRKLVGDVEAFRPTNSGHSPGIGHSIKT
ncbi:hypothetical protein K1719_015535 [Acacia pycnantha]|nr:hypothetical protein K1719_015535 [Acacia pycnantha]